MAIKKVKLKNLTNDYLYPKTYADVVVNENDVPITTSFESSSINATVLKKNNQNVRSSNEQDVIDQNIRELAEGKCKSYVIDTTITTQEAKAYAHTGTVYELQANGTKVDVTNEFIEGEYDEYTYANPLLESQNQYLRFNTGIHYFIIGKKADYSTFVIIKSTGNGTTGTFNGLRTGDIILTIKTDVPDRWYDLTGYFYVLETSKISLEGLMDLTTQQTATAKKTFNGGIAVGGSGIDAGATNIKTSGNLTDGTNSITIAQVVDKQDKLTAGASVKIYNDVQQQNKLTIDTKFQSSDLIIEV